MSAAPPLDVAALHRELGDAGLIRRPVVLPQVDSTNEELRRRARRGAEAGTVVIAESQTAGRGRRGRDWHSPPGLGLYVSCLLRPQGPAALAPRWTLGAALAGCRACREVSDAEIVIKWPNDLLHDGRKLAGILAEMRSGGETESELVVGVGFNVHHQEADFPPAIRGGATSLRLASRRGIVVTRERLAARFLLHMQGVAETLERNEWERLARDLEAWTPGVRGLQVRLISTAEGERDGLVGRTEGLDPSGALRVRSADGRLLHARVAESVVALES